MKEEMVRKVSLFFVVLCVLALSPIAPGAIGNASDGFQLVKRSYATPNDKWYGYTDRDFQRWFHKCWKQKGDEDANKEEVQAAYKEWVKRGKPTNDKCG